MRSMTRPWLTALLLAFVLLAPAVSHGQELQEYRIGPGDRLNITVFGHPDLTVEAVVDGAGRISMPLIGVIQANEKTTAELRDDITVALDKDYIINPRVNVEIANFRPFYILGDVNKPGSYSYIEGMTVRMAVAIAGGFNFSAKDVWRQNETVTVYHVNDPDKKRIAVGPGDTVLPGDTIEIERRLFYILGEVKKPGSFTYIEGMTVRMAVALAGGFNFRAEDVWEQNETVTVYHLGDPDKKKIAVSSGDLVLPGDTIEVERRLFYILGQVNKPGSYTYIEGMTVRMAVAIAGGFTRRAKQELITVIRDKDSEQAKLEMDQSALVLPGDSIEVDRRLF